MKDIPEATRDEYLDGDVTPKVRVTIRRARLDFGAELYYKNDSTVPGIIVTIPPIVKKPTAAFRFTNAAGGSPSGVAPLTVTIIDESLGEIDEWLWEFGDGETSTSSNPGSHEYINEGVYTVSLTVKNSQGSDKLTRYDYVNVTDPSTGPTANFRFTDPDGRDPPYGVKPLTVDIVDLSAGSPVSWKWIFGDGETSTSPTPGTHTYTDKGVYSVSLQVWDADGLTDTLSKSDYVRVSDTPLPPTEDDLFVSRLGSDSTGDGSILNPWKTITYGVGRMNPGTTLNIRGADGGRFHERVNLSNLKGTASAWYTLKSYDGPSAPAIVDGEYSIPTGDYVCVDPKTGNGFVYSPLIKVFNAEYVKLDGIHIANSRGRGIDVQADYGETCKHITLENCHVYSCRCSVTNFLHADTVHVIGGEYYDSMNYCKYRRASGIGLNWAGAMTIEHGGNHLVKDVLLHTSYGEGIHPFTWESGTVQDCVVFNCMNSLLPMTCCDDTLVQRNFVYSTRTGPFWKAAMLNFSMECGKQLHRRQVSKNCRYVNNIAVDGYINNRFMDRLSSASMYAWGFYRDSVFAHNTLVQHSIDSSFSLVRWIKQYHYNDIKTIEMCNNIYWCQGVSADIYNTASSQIQPKYRYNCWHPQASESETQGTGDYYGDPVLDNVDANLTADGSLGYDVIRAQAEKYMLKTTSPLLGQGRNMQGDTYPVDEDFWGNARGASPDMGAHER